MPNYRRAFIPGGTFFFTIVTFQRRKIFSDPRAVELLRKVMREEQLQNPFTIEAAVILPDHLHLMWRLPDGDSKYSSRIGRIKAGFTRLLSSDIAARTVAGAKGYSTVWQPRFWEHVIRDEQDFEGHLNYIHYNPVKHGYTKCPHEWPYSSFRKWVENSTYRHEWCCCCDGASFETPDFSAISPDCE
jgi:putative transposase